MTFEEVEIAFSPSRTDSIFHHLKTRKENNSHKSRGSSSLGPVYGVLRPGTIYKLFLLGLMGYHTAEPGSSDPELLR